MSCPSKVGLGDNVVFSICTHDPDTGVLADADGAPAYRVYEQETPTAILTGSMSKLDNPNTTGFYSELLACTVPNGFELDKTYTIYIEATVDSDTGGICFAFNIRIRLIGYWNFNANNWSFNYNARIKAFNFNANSKAFNFNARATPGV